MKPHLRFEDFPDYLDFEGRELEPWQSNFLVRFSLLSVCGGWSGGRRVDLLDDDKPNSKNLCALVTLLFVFDKNEVSIVPVFGILHSHNLFF